MLEDNLDVITPAKGQRLETPSLEELDQDYEIAADIKAKPILGYDCYSDVGRILTLKPNVALPHRSVRVDKHIHRGYFALGRKDGDNVIFDVYGPLLSIKGNCPSKQLETAVAMLAVKLLQNGYNLPANSVNYTCLGK